MLKLVNSAQATGTLNIDTAVAGTTTAGPTVLMSGVATGSLSANLVCDIETSTITMSAIWQVSDIGATWIDCLPSNGAAYVVLGTGTAGADATVTVTLPANEAVYGWRLARVSIRNGVTTGAATDTYSISYNYARPALSYNRPNQ